MTKKSKYIFLLILLLFFIVAIILNNSRIRNNSEYIKIFYPDKNVEYWLIKETPTVSSIEELINKLIKDKDLMIPNETKLNNLYIDNGTLYLDFNEKFLHNNGDYLADKVVIINVYSIVNTVCLNTNFSIQDVAFLINGERERMIGPLINYENFKPNIALSGI